MTIDDVADQAAAAADLNSQARGRVELDQDLGQSATVLVTCILETRTPLPTDILREVRAQADDWFLSDLRPTILDAVDAQERLNAA